MKNVVLGKGDMKISIVSEGREGPLKGILFATLSRALQVADVVPLELADAAEPTVFLWFEDPKSIDILMYQLATLRLHYGKHAYEFACGGRQVTTGFPPGIVAAKIEELALAAGRDPESSAY